MSVASGEPRRATGGLIAVAVTLGLLAAAVTYLPLPGVPEWMRFAAASLLVVGTAFVPGVGLPVVVAALFGAVGLRDLAVASAMWGNLFFVVLVGALIAVIVHAVRSGHPIAWRLTPLEWAMLGMLGAGLWSLPASLDPAASIAYLGRMSLLAAAGLLVSRVTRTPHGIRLCLDVFVAVSVALALLALAQWAAPDLGIGRIHVPSINAADVTVRPSGFYLDPNFLGAHLSIAALAVLASAARSKRRWWPIAAAVLLFAAVAVTYSRSAWLAASVGLVTLALLGGRRARVAVAVALLVGMVAGAALVGPERLLGRAGSVIEAGPESAGATRIGMARSSLAMIADRPVFGTGLEAFDEAYPDYRLPGAEATITHPHQVPLAFIAETGVAGALALLGLIAATLVTARRLSGGDPAVRAALLAGVVAIAAGALFQFFLYWEVAWLWAGLLSAAGALLRPERSACASGGADSGKE